MRKFLKKILLWLKKNPPKYKFVLTSDFSFDEKNADFVISEGGNTMVIPTKNILKIEELPLKYKFK